VEGAPRVLIADDHPPTRMGVRMALERDGLAVCGEAHTAEGAVELALRERPDACLLDVHMPGGGPAAASSITTRLPDTVVIMLSVSREEADLLESLRRGASGYLLKDMNPDRLSSAVRAALHGEAMVPRTMLPSLIEELRDLPGVVGQPHTERGLTRRQAEVLQLLREGASTAEIAQRLFLSEVTVRRHISTIAARLGAVSRDDLIRIASLDPEGAVPAPEERP
jgi:two-component system, NarL family, nitrate/nitrite response regulator NarL